MRASLIFQNYFSISCFKISNFLIVIFFFIWIKKAFFGIINKKKWILHQFLSFVLPFTIYPFYDSNICLQQIRFNDLFRDYIKKYSLAKKHFFPRYLLDNNSSYKFDFFFLQIRFTECFLYFMSPKCLILMFSTKNTSAYIYISK